MLGLLLIASDQDVQEHCEEEHGREAYQYRTVDPDHPPGRSTLRPSDTDARIFNRSHPLGQASIDTPKNNSAIETSVPAITSPICCPHWFSDTLCLTLTGFGTS